MAVTAKYDTVVPLLNENKNNQQKSLSIYTRGKKWQIDFGDNLSFVRVEIPIAFNRFGHKIRDLAMVYLVWIRFQLDYNRHNLHILDLKAVVKDQLYYIIIGRCLMSHFGW